MAHAYVGGVSPSALWQFGRGKDRAAWLAALRRGDCAQVNDRIGRIACERSPCRGAWCGCAKMPEYVENRGCVGGPTPSGARPASPSGVPAQNRMIGGAKKNVKNEAKREMRNMNSDEGLSQDGSIAGRKTKPPIRATAQCSLPDADVPTGSTDHVGRDRSVAAETPVLRRNAAGRPAGRTPRLARETLKAQNKAKGMPDRGFVQDGWHDRGLHGRRGRLGDVQLGVRDSTVRATKAHWIALGTESPCS